MQNYSGQEEISKACQGESKTPLSFAFQRGARFGSEESTLHLANVERPSLQRSRTLTTSSGRNGDFEVSAMEMRGLSKDGQRQCHLLPWPWSALGRVCGPSSKKLRSGTTRRSLYRSQAYSGNSWEGWQSRVPEDIVEKLVTKEKAMEKAKNIPRDRQRVRSDPKPRATWANRGWHHCHHLQTRRFLSTMDTTWMQPPPPFNETQLRDQTHPLKPRPSS